MSNSLRDQLVKAGLATAGQARKAEREQAAARRHAKGKSGKGGRAQGEAVPAPDSPEAVAKARARQLQAEKKSRDRAIARARNEKAAAKALRAQLKQIVAQNDQRAAEARDDDQPYHFAHGRKIKKIYVRPEQVDALSAGRLVIVNNDGRYHIVSQSVAEQIRARDPKWIVAAHDGKAQSSGEDDAYYSQFEVPDDLDW